MNILHFNNILLAKKIIQKKCKYLKLKLYLQLSDDFEGMSY